MTHDSKELVERWRNDAFEKSAQIVLQYGADPAIAFDIRALKSADVSAPQPGMRAEGEVVPLDWQETSNDRGVGSREISGYEADSGFGPWYVINQYFSSDSLGFEVDFDGTKIGDCESADAAKDVAQDHYAQRIRAAIVPGPPPPKPAPDAMKTGGRDDV